MSAIHDLLIRGAEIVDGTGAPRFEGDVAVDDGRIVRVGDLAGARGRAEVDARGLVLAPGFIDAHTHDDRAMLSDGAMAPKVSQGVTTVIAGSCGISLAPRPPRVVPPLDLLDGDGGWFRYERYGDYLQALREQPAATNCAMLLGHITLRVAAVPDLEREAAPAEIAVMRARVEEALEAGAIGVSTGLAYAPSRAASTQEVIEVCRPLRARRHLHHAPARRGRHGDGLPGGDLSHRPRAGRAGGDLAPQGGGAGQSWTLGPDVGAHRRADENATGLPGLLSVQRLVHHPGAGAGRWRRPRHRHLVKAHPQFSGRDLDEVARELGCPVEEAVRRLQPAGAIYFRMHEDDVARILQFDETMVGSDGLPHDETPHPRLWGSFPRVLGHYARGLGLFPLEKAIHKMTGLTAARFGLADRGVLREGAHADLVLLDAGQVADRATFAQPIAPSAGIVSVWTNGRPVWRDGKTTGERPGQVLRREA